MVPSWLGQRQSSWSLHKEPLLCHGDLHICSSSFCYHLQLLNSSWPGLATLNHISTLNRSDFGYKMIKNIKNTGGNWGSIPKIRVLSCPVKSEHCFSSVPTKSKVSCEFPGEEILSSDPTALIHQCSKREHSPTNTGASPQHSGYFQTPHTIFPSPTPHTSTWWTPNYLRYWPLS